MANRSLSPFFLTMVILGTILSIRNWPFLVEYGFSSLFFLLMAVLVFFIPVSLVSAELASGWPEKGGIYVWVREALGARAGFLSIWFLWISNVVWYPTILSFIASSFFYSFAPQLAEDPFWVMVLMLSLFWTVVIINLFGIQYSARFGTFAFLIGTLVPGIAMVVSGVVWLAKGNPSHVDLSFSALFPSQARLNEWIFLVSMVLSFAGMEMNAVHAREVERPNQNFPRAIFISACVIIFLTAMGILSIGIVIPKEKVSIGTAVMEAIAVYLHDFGILWMMPFFSLMIGIGGLGCVSSWILGTSKGLLFASENGNLPKIFFQQNRYGVPVLLMLVQAVLVSFLAFVFIAMPNLNSAFWILIALSSQLYLITYVLMFLAGIILRLKRPEMRREYSIPGGNVGMFGVSGLGLLSCFFAFGIGFIPPAQIQVQNLFFYELFLVMGIAICSLVPYFLLRRDRSFAVSHTP